MAVIIRELTLKVEVYFRNIDAIEMNLPVNSEYKEGDVLLKVLSHLTVFELKSLQKLKIVNTSLTPWLFDTGGWVYFDKRNLKAWSNYILLDEFIASRNASGDF
nr:hypothetical protein K-LCC10_0434 [Kaumoebavirus]